MKLKILLQISEYNIDTDEYLKSETKISLSFQYSVSFSGSDDEVDYILVWIKICLGKYMDIGHYLCNVLNYNIVTRWEFDDDIITNFSGYPENFHDDLSHESKQNIGKELL